MGYSPWDCKESDRTEQLTFSLLQLKENIDDLSGPQTQYGPGLDTQRQVMMMSATPC